MTKKKSIYIYASIILFLILIVTSVVNTKAAPISISKRVVAGRGGQWYSYGRAGTVWEGASGAPSIPIFTTSGGDNVYCTGVLISFGDSNTATRSSAAYTGSDTNRKKICAAMAYIDKNYSGETAECAKQIYFWKYGPSFGLCNIYQSVTTQTYPSNLNTIADNAYNWANSNYINYDGTVTTYWDSENQPLARATWNEEVGKLVIIKQPSN